MSSRFPPRRPAERGYTLIEITMVVVILGLLIAIALPSFTDAKNHASNRSAQTSLRHTLTNAKTIYSDDASFAGVTPAALHAIETSLTFANGTSNGPKVVSVASTDDDFVAVAKSTTGLCYAIGDAGSHGGTVFGLLASSDACDASNAPPVPTSVPALQRATIGGGWAQGW